MKHAAVRSMMTVALLAAGATGSPAMETLEDFDPTGDKVITDFCSPEPTGQIVEGFIDSIVLDDPSDTWSGGTMVVAGTEVVIPRNLIITLPANWQTLQQLFANAPPACQLTGESGLAIADTCANGGLGGFATILANRVSDFRLIAGDVDIGKNPDALTGPVTHIDYTNGYFEINGIPGLPGSGQMVRLNDPDGVHTIQQGPGCDPTMPNCSADVRYTNDPDNYTATFATGYPWCLPSTVTDGVNRLSAANASGVGDPFCPQTNRPADPFTETVNDSRFFAPLRVGDTISAEGNFEDIGGVHFLSAHTVSVNVALVTRPDPDQPDYMTFDEVEWDAPGYSNARVRTLLIGFTTLLDSQLDIYSLNKDPSDPNNEDNFIPLASTVGNPLTTCQGVGGVGPICALAQGGGIFKINYDVDFLVGVKPSRSPCENLFNAGLRASGLCSLAEEFSILAPITSELQAFTRHGEELKAAGVENFNIRGDAHTYGQYLNPVGIGHAEFVEINLGLLDFPFSFSGLTWNLDRRLRVAGCDGLCEDLASAPLGTLGLDPFPWEEADPRTLANAPLPVGAEDRMFAHFPFGPTDFTPWPPPASTLSGDVVCDDGNPCTDDSCVSATGCVFTPNANVCDDGDLCTENDVCSAGVCAGTPIDGCSCAVLGVSTAEVLLPAAGQTMSTDVTIDTVAPLGAYSIDISWNAAALQLDSVTGGTTVEFSGLPLCNIDNVAGTASCAAAQSLSLTTPTGLVSIATLNWTVLDTSGGSESITVSVESLFDATPTGAGIASCNPLEVLTLTTLCGDVNGDQTINVADALLVAQYQVALRACDDPVLSRFDMCDIAPTGGDGGCTIGDALRMAQCDVGLISCDFTCAPLQCLIP